MDEKFVITFKERQALINFLENSMTMAQAKGPVSMLSNLKPLGEKHGECKGTSIPDQGSSDIN